MELHAILIPLDGSHRAESALAYAHALAATAGSRLVVVRAVPGVPFLEAGGARSLADNAEQYLERIAVGLPDKVGISVLIGDPAAVIARVARVRHADLVVMAMSGRAHLGVYLGGSVAEQILDRISVPLLIIGAGNSSSRATRLTQHPCVIVPLDGSTKSEAALPVAASLTETLGGELCLLWTRPSAVLMTATTSRCDHSGADRLPRQACTYLRRVARVLARMYCIPSPRVEVHSGTPALVLTRAIHTHGAALVAMAAHAQFDRSRLVFQRLAEVVLSGHRAALLLVRPPTVTSTTFEVTHFAMSA